MKLHLGCGKRNFGSDWIHVDPADFDHVSHKDVELKVFENNVADLIYSSHLFTYFDRQEAVRVLENWHRVLKPGGILRIAVPNFKRLAIMYTRNNSIGLDALLGPLFGRWPINNNTVYMKTTYDFESLKKLLEDCKFKNVKEYNWRETEHAQFDDHSQAYIPHMDKEKGTLISLNVECKK